MKFKHSKMIPATLRTKVVNPSEYAMYAKLSDYSHKGSTRSDLINMYRIWHLFDGTTTTTTNIPGMFDKRLCASYGFRGRFNRDYYYGLPSFPDLVMYIIVLVLKKDDIPNAKDELELFRRAIKLDNNHTDSMVEFIEEQLMHCGGILPEILDKLHFTTSGTGNAEGLERLQKLVDSYTLFVSVVGFSSLELQHSNDDGLTTLTPAYLRASENGQILDELGKGINKTSNKRHRGWEHWANSNGATMTLLPHFESTLVAFKKHSEINLLSTAEDIRRDYGRILHHGHTYYILGNVKEMQSIHENIKKKIPSNVTCRTFADVYSTTTSKSKNFKVKMRLPSDVLHDDADRLKRIFDKLYDIDPKFLVSDSHHGLDRNRVNRNRTLSVLKTTIIPRMLQGALNDEFNKEVASHEVVSSLRNQKYIIEQLAPTKIGEVYQQFDEDVFEALAEVYYRKNLTISFYVDSLSSVNRLKLLGLNVMSIEYSYYHWQEVLEYLENR